MAKLFAGVTWTLAAATRIQFSSGLPVIIAPKAEHMSLHAGDRCLNADVIARALVASPNLRELEIEHYGNTHPVLPKVFEQGLADGLWRGLNCFRCQLPIRPEALQHIRCPNLASIELCAVGAKPWQFQSLLARHPLLQTANLAAKPFRAREDAAQDAAGAEAASESKDSDSAKEDGGAIVMRALIWLRLEAADDSLARLEFPHLEDLTVMGHRVHIDAFEALLPRMPALKSLTIYSPGTVHFRSQPQRPCIKLTRLRYDCELRSDDAAHALAAFPKLNLLALSVSADLPDKPMLHVSAAKDKDPRPGSKSVPNALNAALLDRLLDSAPQARELFLTREATSREELELLKQLRGRDEDTWPVGCCIVHVGCTRREAEYCACSPL